MKKTWLVVRLLVETTFGSIYVSGLFLLPTIWRYPLMIMVGFLGMPRGHADPAVLRHINTILTFVGSLVVTVLFLTGLLWFKDALEVARALRQPRIEPQSSR